MTAVGLLMLGLGFLIGALFGDEDVKHFSPGDIVAVVLVLFGSVFTMTGVFVFVWRVMP